MEHQVIFPGVSLLYSINYCMSLTCVQLQDEEDECGVGGTDHGGGSNSATEIQLEIHQ